MINEEYNKWLILYFDMQSINLQFNCNDIASSLKAQRDKIKQFCIDCLTGVKHQADSFLFDTNACIFSTPKTRGLLFSYEEYPILDTDTTKVVDGKYPLDYATEIIESNLDDIIDYIVQSGTETYNDRTSRPQLTALTKGLYANAEFMLIGGNMKSVSTDGGQNWTTSTLGAYTLTDLIYVDSNWYAIGSNGTKRLLLQNTASTFDQSNKILDLPDYSRQVIKINV